MGWACNGSAGREKRSRGLLQPGADPKPDFRGERRECGFPGTLRRPGNHSRGLGERTHSSPTQLKGDLFSPTFENQHGPMALQFLFWEPPSCKLLFCTLVGLDWKYLVFFWHGRALFALKTFHFSELAGDLVTPCFCHIITLLSTSAYTKWQAQREKGLSSFWDSAGTGLYFPLKDGTEPFPAIVRTEHIMNLYFLQSKLCRWSRTC